jgi:hypothetical protein
VDQWQFLLQRDERGRGTIERWYRTGDVDREGRTEDIERASRAGDVGTGRIDAAAEVVYPLLADFPRGPVVLLSKSL